jgi:hypothetical protein
VQKLSSWKTCICVNQLRIVMAERRETAGKETCAVRSRCHRLDKDTDDRRYVYSLMYCVLCYSDNSRINCRYKLLEVNKSYCQSKPSLQTLLTRDRRYWKCASLILKKHKYTRHMLVKCYYIVTSGLAYLRAPINTGAGSGHESCTQERRVFTLNSFQNKELLTT